MIEYAETMWRLASEGDKQGILFFTVIYSLVICLYSFSRQIFIRQWPTAKGFLITSSVEKWGTTELIASNQEYKVDSLYEYQVSDKKYQGTRLSPWIVVVSHNARFILNKQLNTIQKNDDGTINVFYNPKAPHKSYLVKPGFFGIAVTLGFAFLPLLIYSYEYS